MANKRVQATLNSAPDLRRCWFGVVPAVLIGGIGTILIVLVWMKLFPQLAQVDSLNAGPAATAP